MKKNIGKFLKSPAALWSESWARDNFGDQWKCSFVFSEIVGVKPGKPEPNYQSACYVVEDDDDTRTNVEIDEIEEWKGEGCEIGM